jgi:3',5'-cyclic AMP phosphodiesterase CpdA
MLIAQITDTHISLAGSVLDRNYDTAGHLERAVQHLNALTPRPDVVLLTGDTVDVGAPAEYARLREILSALRPPLYVIPGNHDDREAMRRAFAVEGYLPRKGFLQYTVDDWPVRLVGLDTHVLGESGGTLCEERIAWLAARLAEMPERPTVVFMHHPPFRTGLALMDSIGLRGAEELNRVVSAHKQVRQIISGHIHRPIATVFAGTLATVSPSTAHQAALDLARAPRLAAVMEPPATTLLYWDEESGELVHHLSYIGERPVHVLYDGTQWLLDTPAPPGFC